MDKLIEEAEKIADRIDDDYTKTAPFGTVKTIRALVDRLKAKQAEIDSLMLEYCPDEMTDEQIKEWEKHQVKYKGEGDE